MEPTNHYCGQLQFFTSNSKLSISSSDSNISIYEAQQLSNTNMNSDDTLNDATSDFCVERDDIKIISSFNDERILNDSRLLVNLNVHQRIFFENMRSETVERELLNIGNYFETVQKSLKPFMRKMVVSWMLEVCEEEKCDVLVFPLAVFIMDRFLSTCPISRNIFQLVASVCLFLASKIFNVNPISCEKLIYYSDNSITLMHIIVSAAIQV